MYKWRVYSSAYFGIWLTHSLLSVHLKSAWISSDCLWNNLFYLFIWNDVHSYILTIHLHLLWPAQFYLREYFCLSDARIIWWILILQPHSLRIAVITPLTHHARRQILKSHKTFHCILSSSVCLSVELLFRESLDVYICICRSSSPMRVAVEV